MPRLHTRLGAAWRIGFFSKLFGRRSCNYILPIQPGTLCPSLSLTLQIPKRSRPNSRRMN